MKSRSEVCEERGEASSPRPPSPLARLPVGHSWFGLGLDLGLGLGLGLGLC